MEQMKMPRETGSPAVFFVVLAAKNKGKGVTAHLREDKNETICKNFAGETMQKGESVIK